MFKGKKVRKKEDPFVSLLVKCCKEHEKMVSPSESWTPPASRGDNHGQQPELGAVISCLAKRAFKGPVVVEKALALRVDHGSCGGRPNEGRGHIAG
jgi:hypothetical protein